MSSSSNVEKEFRENVFHFVSEIEVPSFLSTDIDEEEVKRNAWNALVKKIDEGIRPDLTELRRQLEATQENDKGNRRILTAAFKNYNECLRLSDKYGRGQAIDIGLSKESFSRFSKDSNSDEGHTYSLGGVHFSPLDTWGHLVQRINDILEKQKAESTQIPAYIRAS